MLALKLPSKIYFNQLKQLVFTLKILVSSEVDVRDLFYLLKFIVSFNKSKTIVKYYFDFAYVPSLTLSKTTLHSKYTKNFYFLTLPSLSYNQYQNLLSLFFSKHNELFKHLHLNFRYLVQVLE